MDVRKAYTMPDDFCPVMEETCPRGAESALKCQERFLSDFNPLHNWRDFSILQCACQRRTEVETH